MKNFYNNKKLTMLLKEYPIVYIYCPEKNNSNDLFENNIKSIKFKNNLLKGYNKKIFNGNVLLIYGNNISKHLKELKNIIGLFCKNNKNLTYFITFFKFLNILIFLKRNLIYDSFLNVLSGPIFWFILKI